MRNSRGGGGGGGGGGTNELCQSVSTLEGLNILSFSENIVIVVFINILISGMNSFLYLGMLLQPVAAPMGKPEKLSPKQGVGRHQESEAFSENFKFHIQSIIVSHEK